jgi:mono/diheme cytochrome c family protein
MMNTLVQPRHAKLGIAGHDENWPLAAYANREIRQAFTAIAKAIPRWRGLPVPTLVEAAVDEPLKAIDIAIKQKDAQRFDAAFTQLNQGCNACHATGDHPFVVIKTPDASSFPNQDFRAQQ